LNLTVDNVEEYIPDQKFWLRQYVEGYNVITDDPLGVWGWGMITHTGKYIATILKENVL